MGELPPLVMTTSVPPVRTKTRTKTKTPARPTFNDFLKFQKKLSIGERPEPEGDEDSDG